MDLRTALIVSKVLGLALCRYIPPIVNVPADEVAAWLGPALQRYLIAPNPSSRFAITTQDALSMSIMRD